jgi:hypothetical protein
LESKDEWMGSKDEWMESDYEWLETQHEWSETHFEWSKTNTKSIANYKATPNAFPLIYQFVKLIFHCKRGR